MPDTKTGQAKQLIVRFIRDGKMKRGDKLPSQAFFREKFGFGAAPIISAMHELKCDGVVDVRDKVGVYVLDPETDGHIGRTVAVTAIHLEASMFYSVISSYLQIQLMKHGCLMRLFSPSGKYDPQKTHCAIDDFPGLRRCIENGEISGIIHIDDFTEAAGKWLSRKKVPVLKLGGAIDTSKSGLYLNQEDVLRCAAEKLQSRSCRHPALLIGAMLYPHLKAEYEDILKKFWPEVVDNTLFISPLLDTKDVAKFFAALPREKRPDGIIILDDIQAGGFSVELAKRIPINEMPAVAILRNIQLHVPFIFNDIVLYDIDMIEVASIAASMIVNKMSSGNLEVEYSCYVPSESCAI